VIIVASTNAAHCEERYLLTGKAYGACLGEQMRFVYTPPQTIENVITTKCGKLEEQEREDFFDFVKGLVGQPFTAESALKISAHELAGPQALRRIAIETYYNVMGKGRKSGNQPNLPPK
jgi:hypothetical protein